jgi:hypothetical protein
MPGGEEDGLLRDEAQLPAQPLEVERPQVPPVEQHPPLLPARSGMREGVAAVPAAWRVGVASTREPGATARQSSRHDHGHGGGGDEGESAGALCDGHRHDGSGGDTRPHAM